MREREEEVVKTIITMIHNEEQGWKEELQKYTDLENIMSEVKDH